MIPEWVEEVIPKEKRLAFLKDVVGEGRDYRKALLKKKWQKYLFDWVLNLFQSEYALPYDAQEEHCDTIWEVWYNITKVFFAHHLEQLVLDDIGLYIQNIDTVIDWCCYQLGWLEDTYEEFPNLPHYRYSSDGRTFQYRLVSQLVQAGNNWYTRDYYEATFQKRLEGF